MPSFKEVLDREREEIRNLRLRRGYKDADAEPKVGISFSGGGIRSATINLGILQALAKFRLLSKIDYISTVSGGGFIGGWLVRWIREKGIAEVEAKLGDTTHEPPPVNFLRDYSNYLTPRTGVLGADTWAAVATYSRNLLLNQSILIGFLGTILMVPWILGNSFEYGPTGFPPPMAIGVAGAFLIVVALIGSVINTSTCAAGTEELRKDPKLAAPTFTGQRQVLIRIVLPLFVGANLFTYAIWRDSATWTARFSILAGMSVYATGHLLGWLFARLYFAKAPSVVPSFSNVLWALPSGAFAGLEVIALRHLMDYWQENPVLGKWQAASWGTPLFVLAFLLAGALHIGLAKFALRNEIQEWWARLGGSLMLWAIFWCGFFALGIFAPWGVLFLGTKLHGALWTRGLLWTWIVHSGIGAKLGWGASTVGKKADTECGEEPSSWKEIVAKAAPFVFVIGLLVLISFGVRAIALAESGLPMDFDSYWISASAMVPWNLWGLFLLLAALTVALSLRIDVNRFSMNLLYRNRLVRCYLGASNEQRNAQKFTGFDPKDDVLLAAFADPAMDKQANPEDRRPYSGPFPILNATLNLTHGERLAWQERKAESFSLTPLFCGYEFPEMKPSVNLVKSNKPAETTYLPTSEWAFPKKGPSLGLAIATSGAAVSPNMGYHTYPPLAFFMTVFNVRLGEWLSNTRHREGDPNPRAAKREGGPLFSLLYLLNELFSRTTDRARFVYLSDGAHFENLAIYELVRRQCDIIVASDAGEDHGYFFGDLINLIRKSRTDLGAEIDLDLAPFRPDSEGKSKTHAVRGEIRYADGSKGILLYFKSCLTGNEPNDVKDYRRQHPAFPQESTGDQWFGESQFESYRMLGYSAGESIILNAGPSPTLQEVVLAAPEH